MTSRSDVSRNSTDRMPTPLSDIRSPQSCLRTCLRWRSREMGLQGSVAQVWKWDGMSAAAPGVKDARLRAAAEKTEGRGDSGSATRERRGETDAVPEAGVGIDGSRWRRSEARRGRGAGPVGTVDPPETWEVQTPPLERSRLGKGASDAAKAFRNCRV